MDGKDGISEKDFAINHPWPAGKGVDEVEDLIHRDELKLSLNSSFLEVISELTRSGMELLDKR